MKKRNRKPRLPYDPDVNIELLKMITNLNEVIMYLSQVITDLVEETPKNVEDARNTACSIAEKAFIMQEEMDRLRSEK